MPVSDAVAVSVSAAVITPLTEVFIVSDERMPVSLLSYAMNSAAAAEVSVAVLSELFENRVPAGEATDYKTQISLTGCEEK